jgi:hypothetical protein
VVFKASLRKVIKGIRQITIYARLKKTPKIPNLINLKIKNVGENEYGAEI